MTLFANFSEWIEGVKDWIDSAEYSDEKIREFLALAHTRLNADLNSFRMEGTVSITITAPMVGLPISIDTFIPDFNRIRLFVPRAGDKPSDSIAINEYYDKVAEDASGSSCSVNSYAIDAGKIYPYPLVKEGEICTIHYYKMIPDLAATTMETNTFSIYHPNILLLAAQMEAAIYQVEDERMNMLRASYDQLVGDINKQSINQKYGSMPLTRQIRGL